MPPVREVRKPVGLSSKLTACAAAGGGARARPSSTAAAKLARKAIIGDGYLEMTQRRARLDHRERHETRDQQADDDDDDHRPDLERGHGETVSGTEHGHGAGNLPGRRLSGNCPGGNCSEAAIARPALTAPRLKPRAEWATSMPAVRHGRPFTPIAAAHRGPCRPDGRRQERHRQAAGDAARLAVRRRRRRDRARGRLLDRRVLREIRRGRFPRRRAARHRPPARGAAARPVDRRRRLYRPRDARPDARQGADGVAARRARRAVRPGAGGAATVRCCARAIPRRCSAA